MRKLLELKKGSCRSSPWNHSKVWGLQVLGKGLPRQGAAQRIKAEPVGAKGLETWEEKRLPEDNRRVLSARASPEAWSPGVFWKEDLGSGCELGKTSEAEKGASLGGQTPCQEEGGPEAGKRIEAWRSRGREGVLQEGPGQKWGITGLGACLKLRS